MYDVINVSVRHLGLVIGTHDCDCSPSASEVSTYWRHMSQNIIIINNAGIYDCFVCSLCTTLSVEWEPDLIAISLLYLSCRLMKFKVESWVDKPVGYTGKWYNFFVSDVNLDIIKSEFFCSSCLRFGWVIGTVFESS